MTKAIRHFVLASACRAVETAYCEPRTGRRGLSHNNARYEHIRGHLNHSAQRALRPDDSGDIVHCHAVLHADDEAVRLYYGLNKLAGPPRVISLDHDDHDIKRLPKHRHFAEMKCANRRYSRFVRHLDPNAVFPHRLNMRGPLIDERDVEARARQIRAYGSAVRAGAENRDLWTSHIRAPFLFASRPRFV